MGRGFVFQLPCTHGSQQVVRLVYNTSNPPVSAVPLRWVEYFPFTLDYGKIDNTFYVDKFSKNGIILTANCRL